MKHFNRLLAALLLFSFNPVQAKSKIPSSELTIIQDLSNPVESNKIEVDFSDSLKSTSGKRPFQLDLFGQNPAETTYSKFQFAFVPYVGTNGTNSGNVVNDYSYNLLGGISAGTNKLEIGGLFNINRSHMSGVQLAGWFNQVGGKVDGVQLAGLFNSNLDSVKGVQLAGLANFTTGPVDGVQLAGLMNFSAKSVQGVQLAGIMNFSAADVEGSQISGILNFTANDLHGSQVGFVNFAQKVKGFQLGFLNYSDSISGIPVGFLSFVRSGYHTLELSTNENLPLNLAFRTGKREFYNIFFAGIRPTGPEPVTWSYGYGLGTSPRLGKKTYLNIEISAEQLNQGKVEALNLINRFYVGGELQLTNGLAIFGGPTFNFRVYDTSFAFHPDLFSYSNPIIRHERYHPEDLGSQLWWGFKAGIRFF